METKRTPTLWKRSNLDLPTQIKDDKGRLIAVAMITGGKFAVSQVEAEANARLIAAAPELLEALNALLDCWGYGDKPQGGDSEETKAVLLAREAIRKAKGV